VINLLDIQSYSLYFLSKKRFFSILIDFFTGRVLMRGAILLGRNALLGALVAVFGLASMDVQGQELVADFKAGPPTGVYAFASSTPKDLSDLVKPGPSGGAVNIVGHLFLPQGSNKVPVVLLMHGSNGIYSAMLDYWPKLLNGQGIAVFSLDRFGPRGVKSTAIDQSAVPFTADVADAFAALRLLASHPRIDAQRIAIMGFSRGGLASWRTAVERIIASQQLPDGLRFAAHIQLYAAGCSGTLRLIVKPGVFSKAPELWIHGEADDYTLIGACRDYSKRINEAGTPVEFVSLPGAYHKFDDVDQRHFHTWLLRHLVDSCPLEMDIDTLTIYDHNTGLSLSGDALSKAIKNCTARGVTVEGNSSARDKAGQATVAFLRKVFGL
jgi:dienelactone hydrolase